MKPSRKWISTIRWPCRIDVYCSDGEAKFWIEPEVTLARNYRLSELQIGELTEVIRDRKDEIEAAWKKHFPG